MTNIDSEFVCRICLCSLPEKCLSLFEKYKCFRIFEYINTLANINITEDDGLPDKICQPCFFEFESAVNFKEKCISSNYLLIEQNCDKIQAPSSENLTVKDELQVVKPELMEIDIEEGYFESYTDNEEKVTNEIVVITKEVNGHQQNSPSESQVECHDCGSTFKSKCKLRVHWKESHMLSSLICFICKRTFKSYKAMRVHLKIKPSSCLIANNTNVLIEGEGHSRIFNCKECSYKTHRTKDLATHLRIHTGERPFQCDLCQKTYTQQSSLQTHKETAHKNYLVEITCQYCGKCIKGRNRVYRHLKAHTEGKLKCNICKRHVGKRNLSTHMLRHSGSKSFTCEKCAATFYTSAELCNHRRWVHRKGDLYGCDLCEYKSVKKYVLKKHRAKHTDGNIPCTVCGAFFLTLQKLNVHQRRHEEKKFACPECDHKFLLRDSVRKHMVAKHMTKTLDSMAVPVKTEIKTKQCSTPVNLSP